MKCRLKLARLCVQNKGGHTVLHDVPASDDLEPVEADKRDRLDLPSKELHQADLRR